MSKAKIRLDQLIFERGLTSSREKAKALVMAGVVLVDDRPAAKPGTAVDPGVVLRVKGAGQRFVSRGGEKLDSVLDSVGTDVTGLDFLDIGQSTGGFTDALLQRGAAHVTGVDVGYGQLANKLRQDPRVTVIERTNARTLAADAFGGKLFDGAVIDVSFISVRTVMPAIVPHVRPGGVILAMIKPQFEVGRERLGKGGVVKDPQFIADCVAEVIAVVETLGLKTIGEAPSGLRGPKGNQEIFVRFEVTEQKPDAAPS